MSDAAHATPQVSVPHQYHLLNPSPWPVIGSFSAFLTAFGGVQWWHGGTPIILIIGVLCVLGTMGGWFSTVIKEGQRDHAHSAPVSHGLRIGFGLFIASEVMFFVAFFWAFFNAGLLVNPGVSQWPPVQIKPMDAWGIPFLNTLILLSSGLAVNWAHHALKHGNRQGLKWGLGVAILLGISFLSLQIHEYGEATFGFKGMGTAEVFPSVFYMATGFHGFHVFVGTVFLTVNFFRSLRGDFTPKQHIGFEAAAWYWHFVDVVWIFLFVWVYWWGSSQGG